MIIKILNHIYENNLRKWLLESLSTTQRRVIIFIFQLFLVVLAYVLSFLIRFEFNIPAYEVEIFLETLPLLIVARIAAYFYYKVYTGWWRFVDMHDLMEISKSILLGSTIFVLLMAFIFRLENFPRSVILLEAMLNLMLTGGVRFFTRFCREYNSKNNANVSKNVKNVLIVGAGESGTMALNAIRINPELGIRIVGFVDDNPLKKGLNVQGVPIVGNSQEISELIKKHNIDEVIITIPSAPYKFINSMVNTVLECNARVKSLPGLNEIIEGKVFVSKIRDVSCDELLNRKITRFTRTSDYTLLENEIKDKTVLITGAGGSIGSELCRQVLRYRPRLLIPYERVENNLFHLELELRKDFPDQSLLPVIGDILDHQKFSAILEKHNVNLIYHAAAYKHVPMMEREPIEALRNNVFGTKSIAEQAITHNVDKFVFISTDKAVNPTNVMGTTKRVAELIMQGLSGNGTKFISVRFGNVLGSDGSVFPLFKKQIVAGGPLTITHKEVSRFFMAIPEAVELVMTAGAMGQGGEIFLLDMGKPMKLLDLASTLISLSGLEPGKDIEITYTGLRPGEKLHEELYWEGEGIVSTENRKITVLRQNGLDYNTLLAQLKELEHSKHSMDNDGVLTLLKQIVPEAMIKDRI